MKLEGSYRIASPRHQVWNALLNPDILRRVIPGCEKLEATGDHRYNATFRAGVGQIKGVFSGEVELANLAPENSYTMRSRLKATVGFVEGTGRISLRDFEAAAQEEASPATAEGAGSPLEPNALPEAEAIAGQHAGSEGSAEQTLVTYSGDVKIGGLLASIAGRLIEAAARKNMDDMFGNLSRELSRLASSEAQAS